MKELLNFLTAIHPLSARLKKHLVSILKHKMIRKREFLLKSGQISREACFVSTGLLRCYYLKGEHEICSSFMQPGDIVFALESFYTQTPGYESIQALEDTEVYYITHKELNDIYETYPEFNYIGRIITTNYHLLWAQQLYSLRMRSSEERFEWLMSSYPSLIKKVPAKHLCSFLDVSEVTFSKIRTKYFSKTKNSN